jgi:WD repeat-containing protein 59
MRSWQDSIEFVLHGHTRAITDINFSAHHPDVLATCAVDSFIHCWDLRVPARPVISFSDWFAGATQVKWSRQVSHVIASSHDKYLRIWDDRMGAYPVRSIEAHHAKIYGIDWNRQEPNRIVTCSLDKSIKFWDCNKPEDIPERTINTPFPAWRARHTPFGWGLLAMPQRGDCDLHLYDRRLTNGQSVGGTVPAVARFDGHKGQAKEFLWRPRGTIIDGTDHREFQLVTWGTDQELRLHRMIPETLSAIGYEKGVTKISKLNFTRRGARYKTFRDEPSGEGCNEVFESQTGSSPATGESVHPRPRASTSVGMNKVAIPHPQGWLQGSRVTSRIGMHGKTNARQIMNPIDWMKNVKITSWNPETLGEEISHVGEKFAKVKFESVDVPRRKAVISMHGPWGGDYNAPIFMKLDIKFPLSYPREAAAIFNVQKTAAMTDELADMLSTELRTIAETYLSRKRGCLEAVLRYVLREQDMEQIVSWILDESLEDSKIVDEVAFEEVSSDEDDVGVTTFQGPPGIMNSTELLNANVMVPVPKGCGALWADNCRLVCFFPPKPKHPTSFLELLGTRNNDSDKSDKIFEGFGRLKPDSPGARTTLKTMTSGEDQTSDLSDDSSFSCSSSSGSSDNLVSLPTHFFPRNAWRAGGGGLQRTKSADHSTQSAIGLSNAKFGADLTKNVVSIHTFDDLIPSKRELAMDYIVFGKGPDMCGYNADVAMRQGQDDLTHIWRLMRLILQDEVPLEIVSDLHTSSDILAVAQSSSNIMTKTDSGVDLSYDGVIRRTKADIPGRVRWGESALGGKFLVPALIHHFECVGDVQMLAMLSCVFAEPKASDSLPVVPQNHHQHRSMQLKAPAFSIDYHPSLEVARSIKDKASTTSFASATLPPNTSDSRHMTLIDKAGHSNPTTPYSTGTTPPNLSQNLTHQPVNGRRPHRLSSVDIRDPKHRGSASTIQSKAISLSTSPEDTRVSHRPNSNLSFGLSRASLAALAPSFSQSPPNSSNLSTANKRSSPVGSLMGHHVNAGGWSAASLFGGAGSGRTKPEVSARTPRARTTSDQPVPSAPVIGHSQSMSSDGDVHERARGRGSSSVFPIKSGGNARTPRKSTYRTGAKRKVKIKSVLHNQNMFDKDGYASVPLLDPNFEWKYKAYRASYAHLLGVWGLQTQRAEVLKFDGLIGYFTPTPQVALTDRAMSGDKLALESLLRRRTVDVTRDSFAQNRGLEIHRRCNQCGEALKAIEKNRIPVGWHCAACAHGRARSSTQTLCAICTKSITGLMVPCLNCAHVTCFECHLTWLGRDNNISTTGDPRFDPLETANKTCPTGCGCLCSSHHFVTVPYPSPSEIEDQQGHASESRAPILTASEAGQPMPTHSRDTAIGAFLSLSRSRSASDRSRGKSFSDSINTRPKEEMAPDAYTDAWAKHANMGKGLGAGLTRTSTLRERGSDMTIKRESEAEARLRKAGCMYE